MKKQTPHGTIALRVLTTPRDLNPHGTVFGGAMLAYFDIAGAAYAMKNCGNKVVLASVKEAVFFKPTYQDEQITFYAQTARIGKTSITVDLEAWRLRPETEDEPDVVAKATLVFVAVGKDLRPTPIKIQSDSKE